MRKYYDLSEKYIPKELLNAPGPLTDDFEHQKWRILRCIGAVGLLWNHSSDAWLNIWGLKPQQRNEGFRELLNEEKIFEVKVEGLKDILFCRSEDLPLIEIVLQNDKFKPRCELIAPLDCMMWYRKLIHALFDFDYSWEIYTPADKRKYGFYVLPLLNNDSFIGRMEAVADKKASTLMVENIWYENGVKQTKRHREAIERCITRFAEFNECNKANCDIPDYKNLLVKSRVTKPRML